ncbi:MAG TPA: UDP-N-acetylglucosamine 2-epimerase [Candidatus Paceibacterota bacterium]
MKKICVLTGTRAEYGLLYPVMSKIRETERLSLQLLATHMHFLPEFGSTYQEIERDGFTIDAKIVLERANDSPLSASREMGEAVGKIAESLKSLRPDIVLVVGDRPEILAAAFAANIMQVPIAQLHAGEVSGHIDGIFRHAITKLAHLLLAPTQAAYERILKLGEEPWRASVVGAPALDRIIKGDYASREKLVETYKLDPKRPIALVVFHPVQGEETQGAEHLHTLLDVARARDLQAVVAYPNADPGSSALLRVLAQYENDASLRLRKSISHRNYLGLLRIADVLAGNSSSGIIEAPSFGLPVINIGSRQEGRERAGNVIDTNYNAQEIAATFDLALSETFRKKARECRNPYGDGTAAEKIVAALLAAPERIRLLNKKMTY